MDEKFISYFTKNFFVKISLILIISISIFISDNVFKNNINTHFTRTPNKNYPRVNLLTLPFFIFIFFFTVLITIFMFFGFLFTFFNEQLGKSSFNAGTLVSDIMTFSIVEDKGKSLYNPNFLMLIILTIIMSFFYYLIYHFLLSSKSNYKNQDVAMTNYKDYSRKLFIIVSILILLI